MSESSKNNPEKKWYAFVLLIGVLDLLLLLRRHVLKYNAALFNPQGLIAKQQHSLMLYTGAVLLLIGIPSLALLYFTAWKYRETNTRAAYQPTKHGGPLLDFAVWAIPSSFMLLLAVVMWPAAHRLAPQKAIASTTKPLTIQVVSMRWKWLFIYPQQHIATVNFVQVPVDTPIRFELTADEAPMSSFWIPNLGGQLYSMTGMVNQLNLMADQPGDYPGSSAELNGAGFSGMKFVTRASDAASFENWVHTVKQSPTALDDDMYASIVRPSQNMPVSYFSNYDDSLYDKVLMKYMGPAGGHSHHE